jgi:hypothetical protein
MWKGECFAGKVMKVMNMHVTYLRDCLSDPLFGRGVPANRMVPFWKEGIFMRKCFLLLVGVAMLALAPPSLAAIKSINANDLATSYAYSGGGAGAMTVLDSADIVVEDFSGVQTTYSGGQWSLSTSLANDYSIGGLADADFVGGQLVLSQGSTQLLTANLVALALTETRATSNVLAGFGTFEVQSGTLMSDFGTAGEVFMLEFRLSSNVSSFGQNFAGRSDMTLVPEPMTLALLGLGGLVLRRRMA